jgi:phospholipase C
VSRTSLWFSVLILLASAGTLFILSEGCSLGQRRGDFSSGKIQHVVIIVQENRTPDNLFHDLRMLISPTAE